MVNIVKELLWGTEPKEVKEEPKEKVFNSKKRSKKGSKFKRTKMSSKKEIKEVEEDVE